MAFHSSTGAHEYIASTPKSFKYGKQFCLDTPNMDGPIIPKGPGHIHLRHLGSNKVRQRFLWEHLKVDSALNEMKVN